MVRQRPKRYVANVFAIAGTPGEAETLRWQRFRRFGGAQRGPNAMLAAFLSLRRRPKRPKRYAGSVFGVAEASEEALTLRWQPFWRCRGARGGRVGGALKRPR